MALETANYIDELVITNPTASGGAQLNFTSFKGAPLFINT